MSKKWIGLVVIVVGAAALVVVGLLHLRHGRVYPATENAYVSGNVVPIAGRIGGTVTEVRFAENERVEAGQVLVQLDPRDLDEAVRKAEAQLAKAQALLAQDQAQIAGAQAQIDVARSQAEQAVSDRERYQALEARGSAPQRQAEQARTAANTAQAQVEAARKALAAAQAKLAVDQEDVARYDAELANARLQRTYCTITAPTTGMAADKSVQPGQVIAPGQPLCRVAPLAGADIWIDANFKETQLQRIRPGQPVTIEVDALGDHVLHGTVADLSAGTGAAFALLPPENASGNWVKIVQRLPVRITLAAGDAAADRLRLGLSATVTVDTRGAGER